MNLTQLTRETAARPRPDRSLHSHFWERAISRRAMLKTAGGAAGVAVGASIAGPWLGTASAAGSSTPKHVKGGIRPFGPGTELFHLFPPGAGNEPSTITDFRGHIGLANVSGSGTGKRTATGETQRLAFDVDLRFMQGHYVDRDGNLRFGTFGFV